MIPGQVMTGLSHCPSQVRKHINDLYEDLRDGHNLISLLEVLSGIKLVRAFLLMSILQMRLLTAVHTDDLLAPLGSRKEQTRLLIHFISN